MMCIVYLLNKHSSGAYMFVAYKILYDYKINIIIINVKLLQQFSECNKFKLGVMTTINLAMK